PSTHSPSSTCARRLFSHSHRPLPDLHSFPTRRSSDLVAQEHVVLVTVPRDVAAKFVPVKLARLVITNVRDRAQNVGQSKILRARSEEHTSELQSPYDLVCRLLLEQKKRVRGDGSSQPR